MRPNFLLFIMAVFYSGTCAMSLKEITRSRISPFDRVIRAHGRMAYAMAPGSFFDVRYRARFSMRFSELFCKLYFFMSPSASERLAQILERHVNSLVKPKDDFKASAREKLVLLAHMRMINLLPNMKFLNDKAKGVFSRTLIGILHKMSDEELRQYNNVFVGMVEDIQDALVDYEDAKAEKFFTAYKNKEKSLFCKDVDI